MPFSIKQLIFICILIISSTHLVHSIEPRIKNNHASDNTDSQLSVSIYDLLYSAITMDSSQEVKMFVEFGADINHRYANGKTPLMIASSIGSINTIILLLELGADPQLQSNSGMTALDYANKTNEMSVINILNTSTTSHHNQSISNIKHANDIIVAEDIPITN